MANGKKSFIMYCDWIETFEDLTNEEAGKLIKHIFKYVNDKNPEEPDRVTKLLFTPIKNTLKRDLNKWENLKEDRSNAGKLGNLKRYNPDIYKKVIDNKITANEGFAMAESRKESQSDTKLAVNDSVSVNVNDTKYNKPQLSVKESFDIFWDHYHECTGRKKEDKEPSFKKWKKLTLEERRKAYMMTKDYSKTNETKYLKMARTYLSNKNFNDEFTEVKEKKEDIELYVKNHLTYEQSLGYEPVKNDVHTMYNGMYWNPDKSKFENK